MRILITGSSGMLGKEIIVQLGKKHAVVPFDRDKGGDITRKEMVRAAMRDVNVVIHAAAEIDETKSKEELWEVNVEGVRNVIEAAREEGVTHFIHVSSTGVYGDPGKKVTAHTTPHPDTVYEESKHAGEKIVKEALNEKGKKKMNITIVRPALMLGPNTYWGSIFTIIKKGFPLIGEGKNPWQMIYYKDTAAFIVNAIGNTKTYNKEFVLAEKEVYSLREIVDMIADIQYVKHVGSVPVFLGVGASYLFWIQGKLMGKKPLLIPAHVKRLFKHREYDISPALNTGWKPKYTTKQALSETFELLNKKK